jgi:hypothetical protein
MGKPKITYKKVVFNVCSRLTSFENLHTEEAKSFWSHSWNETGAKFEEEPKVFAKYFLVFMA